ncbi:MAG: fibrobacter succinogenes major paralogous domain-containing protein [Bacteroidales bacterium]|nr:fibrobacter succinogenes major paralogous domain-containing protein [Bacteroidales bacterium]
MLKFKVLFVEVIILFTCYVSCEKVSDNELKKGILVDTRDNKRYKTIKIDEQIWMAENLNYYSDSGSWAYNDSNHYSDIYGRLYNWETACKVCPEGWHLPTEKEWTILSDYNGGQSFAGINLKIENAIYWYFSQGIINTNESGFSALPAGYRTADGEFYEIGRYTGYWSSSPSSGTDLAWCRRLSAIHNNFGVESEDINSGRSVRCLKDD